MPRADGAIPHEDGYVEEHVDGGLERIVESLETEPIIPCEGVSGDEASENAWNASMSVCHLLIAPRLPVTPMNTPGLRLTRHFQSSHMSR